MQQKLITIAKYANLRGLNRSPISRQVAAGKIPTIDGRIDPAAADRARERNLLDFDTAHGSRAVRDERGRDRPESPMNSGR